MRRLKKTELIFLGTTACIFDKDDDTPSFLINESYLVDTGWALVNNLVRYGIDPLQIQYLFFTHMHHDHYLALPQLLFYFLQCGGKLEQLTIVGPAKDVERIVAYAMQFIEAKACWDTPGPKVIALKEKEALETEDMRFETCRSVHGVEGFCYRITDRVTGKVICYTGDTARNEELIRHFAGCDLLIHEISLGLSDKSRESERKSGHSTVQEAVELANRVGAKQLFFVHNSKAFKQQFLEYADLHLKGKRAVWPDNGIPYEL